MIAVTAVIGVACLIAGLILGAGTVLLTLARFDRNYRKGRR